MYISLPFFQLFTRFFCSLVVFCRKKKIDSSLQVLTLSNSILLSCWYLLLLLLLYCYYYMLLLSGILLCTSKDYVGALFFNNIDIIFLLGNTCLQFIHVDTIFNKLFNFK